MCADAAQLANLKSFQTLGSGKVARSDIEESATQRRTSEL